MCDKTVAERRRYQRANERSNKPDLEFLEFVKDAASGLLRRLLVLPRPDWEKVAIRRELARRGVL